MNRTSFFCLFIVLLATAGCAEITVEVSRRPDGGADTSSVGNNSDTSSTDTQPDTETDDVMNIDAGSNTGTSTTCSDSPCDPNATCADESDGYTCQCNPGWTGNGMECNAVPDNDCANGSHTCDANATCTYTGSHTYDCDCNAGWQGDGETCGDVNECDAGTDNCDEDHGECANTPGSFDCDCAQDWHLDTDDNITCLCDQGITCDDNDPCTTNDTCDVGVCAGELRTSIPESSGGCDDEDACTDDTCNPQDGTCSHSDTTCEDNNGCTDNSCNPATGCVFTNNSNTCIDENHCTTSDTCSGGICVGGEEVVCNDGNVCTNDSCDPVNGQCVFANNSNPCDDGLYCNVGEACSGGTCTGGSPMACNDDNICTDDSCNDTTDKCDYVANSAPCDDSLYCNEGEACSGGTCTGGSPRVCDDSDECTNNTCNETTDQCDGAPHSICAGCPSNQHCVDTGTCICQVCADSLYCGAGCTACSDPDTPYCKNNGNNTSTCVQCIGGGDCESGSCTDNVCDCFTAAHQNAASAYDEESCGFSCDVDKNSSDYVVGIDHVLSTGSNNNRIVIVGVHFTGSSNHTVGWGGSVDDRDISMVVKYNNVDMTPVINNTGAPTLLEQTGIIGPVHSNDFTYVSLWYMLDDALPSSAATYRVKADVSATGGPYHEINLGVADYTAVNQSAPKDFCTATTNNEDDPISCTLDATNTCVAAVNSMVMSVVGSDHYDSNNYDLTSGTRRWEEGHSSSAGEFAGGDLQASGASTSVQWDINDSSSDYQAMIAASWEPAQ